uniref:KilA-N domain-containing protein n=1 Tax=viral metagenome TaxID=1070528 RepID=A0A6C0CYZ9_9ZZZZ
MQCDYCKRNFKTVNSLNTHKNTAKFCLRIRGIIENTEKDVVHNCEYCDKILSTKGNLIRHLENCNIKLEKESNQKDNIKDEEIKNLNKIISNLNIEIQNTKKELETYIHKFIQQNEQTNNYERQITELKLQNEKLQDTIGSIAAQSKTVNNNHEFVIELNQTEDKENLTEYNNEEEYQLLPLVVGNGITIDSREDGYIDVTNLCKAGGKEFKEWNRLDRTHTFLQALKSTVGIPTVELIQYITGGNGERHTWVHPQVAINIAQWISPEFDVKVSGWIYEVMLTGKVDIKNTKSYRELRAANKDKELKIKYLTKKYVKRQPRLQYDIPNVIYILTTPTHKLEGRYILGKAENLTNRLSVYNKTDEHEVVYYQGCRDETCMKIAEQMIFYNLEQYREQANRERFVLPEGGNINLFIDEIKNTIRILNKE